MRMETGNMTALDKIVSQIIEDSEREAESIIGEAKADAGAILENAEREAGETSARAGESAKREEKALLERYESSSQLSARNSMLSFKQALLTELLADAKAALLELPEEEYFAALLNLYSRFGTGQDGELRLNRRDLSRMPKDFLWRLRRLGGEVKISREPCDIDGGFLLSSGGIDLNCSFSALFEAKENELRDLGAKYLFE